MFLSFVDTNRHHTMRNMNDINVNKVEYKHLWKRDYSYFQIFLKSDNSSYVDVNVRSSEHLAVELYTLDMTEAFIGHAGWYARNPKGIMPTGPKRLVGDIVAPFKPFYIKANDYKCIFVKVATDDCVGKHKVSLDIVEGSAIVDTLSINIETLDISMVAPQDYTFNVEYWHHPYNVAEFYNVEPWSKEHLEILKEHQLLYKQLGGKGVICTLLDEVWGGQTYGTHEIKYPSMIEWIYSKGHWTFDYSIFDKWVDLNIELGLDEKFICYSMMPWGNKMRYFNKDKNRYITRTIPTTSRWRYKRAWTVFLEDFIRHLDARNIFEKVYIGFDERSNMKMILDFLDTFTNEDGKKFKVSASFNNYVSNRACLDRIDSASVGLEEIRASEREFVDVVKDRNRCGKDTSLYTATEHFPNSFALSLPAESYYTVMYSYSLGNNGFLRWAYDAWVKNPLVDTTHWSFQAGDCFLIYPNTERRVPSLSYRLVKLDEAVRDVNKLAILRQNPKLAGEIARMLAKVGKDYSYRIEYDPSWGKAIRKAKWADDTSIPMLINDVNSMENMVEELSIAYVNA